MSRRVIGAAVVLIAAGAFWAGLTLRHRPDRPANAGSRKILYWADPMNPAVHVDGPGTAPCGMPYQPVYADGSRGADDRAGSIAVSPEAQQRTGVRVETASVRAVTFDLRLLGRVAADETRIYRIDSVTDGWIRWLSPAVTGTFVRRDELLASYSSQDLAGPQQAYISALEALDRVQRSKDGGDEQVEISRRNARVMRQQLLNLGMTESQADAIAAARKAAPAIEIRSPADGFVLARNVSVGQRIDRTRELYVIADLGRVWILTQAFGDDAAYLRPGDTVKVSATGSGSTIPAAVSTVLPQVDAATRSLEVRLEADNPGFTLRPDMLVDVDAEVTLPATLVVPAGAVLDSGLQKTAFVARAGGSFERRALATGWSRAGFVEIKSGLSAGEKVAVSGNFLLDSESRMRQSNLGAADGAPADHRVN